MTLIKSLGSETTVRPWRPGQGATEGSRTGSPDPFAIERAELLARAAEAAGERDQAAAQLAELEIAMREAVVRAEAEGREAGLAHATARSEEALARLEAALHAGLAQLAADQGAIESLAAAIAHVALERILSKPDDAAKFAENLIRRQLSEVDGGMLLRIEVSSLDFAKPEQLAHLTQTIGRGRAQVLASPDLASGECRLKLKLGELEIGAPQQWRRLSTLLHSISDESCS